jgi:copper(I)-binding protein
MNPSRRQRRQLLAFVATALAASLVVPWARAAEPRSDAVAVTDAWARATPPGAGVAAVYLTIAGGSQADTLVSASTPRAAMTEIHTVTEADGMMQMRPVEHGVPVAPHASVRLAPQGLHLMLMNLPQPLVAGERFPLTLQFARAGSISVQVEVRAPAQEAPPPR